MGDVTETDYTTDPPIITERSFTAGEVAQRKADAADAKAEAKTKEDADSQRVATITAARAHAASLGFTNAMLAVMYPQLKEGA
jgi:hypothetical protein